MDVDSLELICDASIYADEADYWPPSFDDLDPKIEKRIYELEEESRVLKSQNDTLNAKLDSLSQEKEENQINLNDCKNALRAYSSAIDEAKLEIQRRNETGDQKKLKLKYLEENVEQCAAIIKELRLTNQELKVKVEERLAFTSLAAMKECRGENVGPISCPLSLVEEIKETERDKLPPPPHPLTADLHTNRCAETVGTLAHVWLFMLCIIILAGLIVGSFIPINISSRVGQLILPFCNVRYRGLPPV